MPADDDDDRPSADLTKMTAALREFLQQDRDDREKGYTRQKQDTLLQNIATEQVAVRLAIQQLKGDIEVQLTSHRIRLEGVEVKVDKLSDRIAHAEEKLNIVSEDTGNFKIILGKDEKTRALWRDRIISAIIAVVVTLTAAFTLRALGVDSPGHAHTPAEK